jgi:methyl-accepting chemotaxis protein
MSDDFASASRAAPSALHRARILAALEAARTAAARATTEQRSASAALRRQQAVLEAVQETDQQLASRGRDLRRSLHLLGESLDRAKSTALNAGLEGARLGEPVGKALIVMADDVRNLLARAVDALEAHSALLSEVERDRERAATDLRRVNDSTLQTSGALGRSEEQGQLASALLSELRTDLGELFVHQAGFVP